jgi:hypothetical protein
MLPTDVKTPRPGGARGVGSNTKIRNIEANGRTHGPTGCQCRINPSGCLECRRWDKRIRGIETRSADSLHQNTGDLMRTGG